MKLTEIEPICESYVELLSRDDLSKIIERPLLEACQCLYDKKIRTLMTSANRYRVRENECKCKKLLLVRGRLCLDVDRLWFFE